MALNITAQGPDGLVNRLTRSWANVYRSEIAQLTWASMAGAMTRYMVYNELGTDGTWHPIDQ